MSHKLVKFFTEIREIFWPLLEPLQNDKKVEKLNSDDYDINNSDDIDFLLSSAEKHYQSEEKRLSDVESKSIIFIGTFGVAITVLINLTKDLVINSNQTQNLFTLLLIVLMTLAVIYLCRAIWFSIKTLKRENYYRIGFPESLLKDQKDMKKKMLIQIVNIIKMNYKTINLKVDYMTMAQEYFKRAIVTVSFFALVIMSKYIYSMKNIKSIIKGIFTNTNIDYYTVLNCVLIIVIIDIYLKVKDTLKPPISK